MFIAYLTYKRSWLALIGFLLLLTNLLILLDAGIRVERLSLIYLNTLFLIVCLCFFLWRYKKETAYYKSLIALQDEIGEDWFDCLPSPQNRFPDRMMNRFLQLIHEQQLTNRQKQQSSQQLEQNDLASWVHEMKTPLTAMKITMDAHRSNELAQRLNASWLKMHLLLDQQLYTSRLATLDSDLLPEKVELNHLLRGEIRELSTWCVEKDLAIEVTGHPTTTVYTDKKWCAFVMRQLLTNAIKYSPSHGTITIHADHSQSEFVVVTITDQGPGIQTHDLPRIFDRGFTGENGRIQHAATGMGLYLAQEISKKLHIDLHVSSVIGSGTSASMTFANANSFEQLRRTVL